MNYSATVSITKRIRLFTVGMLLALLTSLLTVTQPAQADTYVVTNTNSIGPGSLRQAISDANNNPGADTITFDAATDGVPIVLSGAADEDANASGDLDILDGGDLTIQGNGTANTIIGSFTSVPVVAASLPSPSTVWLCVLDAPLSLPASKAVAFTIETLP
jgi:hypothetical protein